MGLVKRCKTCGKKEKPGRKRKATRLARDILKKQKPDPVKDRTAERGDSG